MQHRLYNNFSLLIKEPWLTSVAAGTKMSCYYTSAPLPKVLVLGGTGFIGRNFVHHLVSNNLADTIRVVDKVLPQMAWLNERHEDAFANPIVEFKHANLINLAMVENVFTLPDTDFDFVVNFAAETKYGQTDPVYKEGIVKLSLNCARVAEKHNVQRYIEMSSGQMYSTDKRPVTEDTKCEPWTHLAQNKLQVEEELRAFKGLRYCVIRPGIVYGIGDRMGLAPRLIIGAIYKYIKQKMKMMWTRDLQMNTVHVDDVCRAVWFLFHSGKPGHVYNCVDAEQTTQGKVTELISQVFGISYDFVGSLFSNIARVNMYHVVESINDKHMGPWADACTRDSIHTTPLTPCIDQELLYNKHIYLDGTKLTAAGFTLEKPNLKICYLQEILDDYIKLGVFPPSLLSAEVLWPDQYTDDLHNGLEDSGQDDGTDQSLPVVTGTD